MARERWEDDPEELDDETENYIDLLQQVVTNFIRTGDPNDYTGSPTNHTFDTILPFHQTQMVSNAVRAVFSELFLRLSGHFRTQKSSKIGFSVRHPRSRIENANTDLVQFNYIGTSGQWSDAASQDQCDMFDRIDEYFEH